MMDFYIINDDKPRPKSITGLEFAGSLNELLFEDLQNENIIENHFDYYKDFRLTGNIVKIKLEIINSKQLNDNFAASKFKEILEKAVKQSYGLLASCD